MTSAQIQLLSIDVPITVYPKSKDKKGGKVGEAKFKKPSNTAVLTAAERWREKYEGKQTSVNINDYI